LEWLAECVGDVQTVVTMLLLLAWEDDRDGEWRPLTAGRTRAPASPPGASGPAARGQQEPPPPSAGPAPRRAAGRRSRELCYGYLEMLQRRQLFSRAMRVAHLSGFEQIQLLNQDRTYIHTGRPKSAGAPHPDGPEPEPQGVPAAALGRMCSICRLPVRGIYSWCQGCGHGGHAACISDWFCTWSLCPAGCNHLCQWQTSGAVNIAAPGMR
jgi:hypothetical protein